MHRVATALIITLVASSGKRNVTVWRLSVRLSRDTRKNSDLSVACS